MGQGECFEFKFSPFLFAPRLYNFNFAHTGMKQKGDLELEKRVGGEVGWGKGGMNATYDPMRTVRETCYRRWSKGTRRVHGSARIRYSESK